MKKKKLKLRNPMAATLHNPAFRHKMEETEQTKVQKKDGWDKKAKHKKRVRDYQIGDSVSYKGNEGIIKNHGPLETIGVNINGEYLLLSPEDQENLEIIEEKFKEIRALLKD